jgi:ribose transport system permease protein
MWEAGSVMSDTTTMERSRQLLRLPGSRYRTWQRPRSLGLVLALLSLIAVGSMLSPHFLTMTNLLNVARQMSIVGIVGIGMTFVILTAGIDLSVGSILGFSAIAGAAMLSSGVPGPLAIVLTLAAGGLVGALNGLGVAWGGVQPFIMTLAMLVIARGVTMTYSNGQPIPLGPAASDVAWIGTASLLGVPVPFWLLLIVFGIALFVLKNTRFGWHVYAVGGNREAARRSGLNTRRTIFAVYVISGVLAAISALIVISRLTAGEPSQGTGLELDAIAVVVIGGTSLFGGMGGVGGTMVGAAIVTLMANLLNLLGVSPFSQQIVMGLIILGAVLLEGRARRARRARTQPAAGGNAQPAATRAEPQALQEGRRGV